jgi:TnsA endonuclease-like protein
MAGSAGAAGSAAPAFGVEFTGSGGGCCRGPFGELWSMPFERAVPVRSFPSFRGQVSFPGLYYAATMDAHVGFESWLERDVAMMLDFDPAVVAFSSQPFWLTWAQDGRQQRHVPDYFARLADGTGVVIDVRPDDRIEPRDAEAFAATGRACREVGWLFRRTAGPGAVLAANVRWLAGYRHRRCYRGDIAGVLTGVFAEPKPLMVGTREAGDPVAILPVLYHLLWKQVLVTDVTAGPLGPGSLVSVKREGTGR